jgi:hypothetical protein
MCPFVFLLRSGCQAAGSQEIKFVFHPSVPSGPTRGFLAPKEDVFLEKPFWVGWAQGDSMAMGGLKGAP